MYLEVQVTETDHSIVTHAWRLPLVQ